MNSESSLPLSGFGCHRWFESVFNLKHDYEQAMKVLGQGFGVIPVLKNIEEQVTTFLTEFAVGKEALTIQPPTDYTIKINTDNNIEVFASSFTEYGEQLQGYLDFSEMPQVISDGLQQAFITLSTLNPGEGMVIFSPTEFYKEYDSSSDVINPLLVTNVIKNEKDELIEIKAKGWFLFPNKKLSSSERQLWLECHQFEEVTANDLKPESLVMRPHYLPMSDNQNGIDPDVAIKEYVSWINSNFIDQTGKALFIKDINEEEKTRQGIRQKVKFHINELYDMVVNFKETAFYQRLWQWIKDGQKVWANNNDIDFDWWWNQLQYGIVQIAGFHPADMSNGTDLNSRFNKDSFGRHGHCKHHGEYEGDHCPKCSKKK